MMSNLNVSPEAYISLTHRRYGNDTTSRKVSEKISKFEEWGVPYYGFLRRVNEFESRLLFKYYGGRIQNDEFYDSLFKDKIFAYDSNTLVEVDSRFQSKEDEEQFLLTLIDNIKQNHFETSIDRVLDRIFGMANVIFGFEERSPFPEEKRYFYTGLLSVMSYLFFQAIDFIFESKSELLFFQGLLFLAALVSLLFRAIASFIKKISSRNSTVKSKVLDGIMVILTLPLFLLVLSPFVIVSYIIFFVFSKRR
ncbi:hypothetical protein [Chryseobacterium sp.]|uniref:hypothetical protein n=1 Tax=Chryseobacterium sp. TaxID=1871047 RepID=UPI0012AA19A7|nr:hypothetical protein [Chryseobacterium sp.]QFG52034.1 hypothetical protein F7R58_00095 [Chryseobacterium sp.]